MDAISYTAARQNLARAMDRVCSTHEPIIITRSNDQSVVMISLEDCNALEETAYLLRTRRNAGRLFESIAQLEAGGTACQGVGVAPGLRAVIHPPGGATPTPQVAIQLREK